MKKILVYLSIKYKGKWEDIYKAIAEKQKVDLDEAEEKIKKLDCNYLTILDENYPQEFKTIEKPPFVIFYRGDINLLNSKNKRVAIIGSRENSSHGEKITIKTIDDINSDVCVVSGLAKGIDSIAQKRCLKRNIKTIAILGNGLNHFYPLENKDLQKDIETKGLVISEYPPFSKSCKENFPVRNRIIAALSRKVLVVEAKKRSGTMITVSYALEFGKDVCCYPERANIESGCNFLIQQGARLVCNTKDFLDDEAF